MCKNPSTLRFCRSVIPRALIAARDSPFLGGRAGAAKAAGMGAGSPSTASFGALGQSRVAGTRIRPVFPQRASYFPPHFLFSPFGAPPLLLRDWPALRGSRSTRRLASHQRSGFPRAEAAGRHRGRPRPRRGGAAPGPRPARGCARPFGARPPPVQAGERRKGQRGSCSLARCQALWGDAPPAIHIDAHLRSLQDPGLTVEIAFSFRLCVFSSRAAPRP